MCPHGLKPSILSSCDAPCRRLISSGRACSRGVAACCELLAQKRPRLALVAARYHAPCAQQPCRLLHCHENKARRRSGYRLGVKSVGKVSGVLPWGPAPSDSQAPACTHAHTHGRMVGMVRTICSIEYKTKTQALSGCDDVAEKKWWGGRHDHVLGNPRPARAHAHSGRQSKAARPD